MERWKNTSEVFDPPYCGTRLDISARRILIHRIVGSDPNRETPLSADGRPGGVPKSLGGPWVRRRAASKRLRRIVFAKMSR
jgi:hypothetical protein